MNTLYKVYTAMLEGKLDREMEEKKILPDQVGFRKGTGTMDNIYVLSFIVIRSCRGKEERL